MRRICELFQKLKKQLAAQQQLAAQNSTLKDDRIWLRNIFRLCKTVCDRIGIRQAFKKSIENFLGQTLHKIKRSYSKYVIIMWLCRAPEVLG